MTLLNALQREFEETGDNPKVELQARRSDCEDQGVLENYFFHLELERTYCHLQNRTRHVSLKL